MTIRCLCVHKQACCLPLDRQTGVSIIGYYLDYLWQSRTHNMICKTEGIVFRYIKYRDTSLITTIFTREFGVQSYIINGVRSKSSKSKMAFFQPLTLLDMVVYHRENADINRISEVKCSHPFRNIPYDPKKSTIALFLTEILYKSIKEQHQAATLFSFLKQSVLMLDALEEGVENFHIQFLAKLSRYLGFGLEDEQGMHEMLQVFEHAEIEILRDFIQGNFGIVNRLNSSQRTHFLEGLIQLYRHHHVDMGEIKSLPVLTQVMHG